MARLWSAKWHRPQGALIPHPWSSSRVCGVILPATVCRAAGRRSQRGACCLPGSMQLPLATTRPSTVPRPAAAPKPQPAHRKCGADSGSNGRLDALLQVLVVLRNPEQAAQHRGAGPSDSSNSSAGAGLVCNGLDGTEQACSGKRCGSLCRPGKRAAPVREKVCLPQDEPAGTPASTPPARQLKGAPPCLPPGDAPRRATAQVKHAVRLGRRSHLRPGPGMHRTRAPPQGQTSPAAG